MNPMVIMLACLILLALTAVVLETSAQDERSATAEASVRAACEEPMLVAHRGRRHCHGVRRHVA